VSGEAPPFVSVIVPVVDIAAGTVTLTPPPGLFENLADDEQPPAPPATGTPSA